MDTFLNAIDFLKDPANWSGPGGIPVRIFEHVQMSVYSVLIGAVIAIPIGVWVGHKRRIEFLAISTGNLGRALPSFGVLAFFFSIPFFSRIGDIGFTPTLIAMVFLAVPPILTNSYVGVKGVERDTVEAARGMGMTEWEIVRRIEVPLAAPLVVAGIRTATVQVIATATLAALGGWGGLGRYIIDGRSLGPESAEGSAEVLAGAILVALLAVAVEFGLALVERAAAPRTAREKKRAFWLRRSPTTEQVAV